MTSSGPSLVMETIPDDHGFEDSPNRQSLLFEAPMIKGYLWLLRLSPVIKFLMPRWTVLLWPKFIFIYQAEGVVVLAISIRVKITDL